MSEETRTTKDCHPATPASAAPCVPSSGLLNRLWRFVSNEDSLDCDCQCDGHEEDEPCTSACSQCSWCEAAELIVRWNQEAATAEPFVLDSAANPHPRMLSKAQQRRAHAERDAGPAIVGRWEGYLECMSDATGWPEATVIAWMDGHS